MDEAPQNDVTCPGCGRVFDYDPDGNGWGVRRKEDGTLWCSGDCIVRALRRKSWAGGWM